MTAIQLTPVEVTAVQIANVLTAQPVGLLAPCLLGSQTPQVIKWWTPVVCTAAPILPGFSGAPISRPAEAPAPHPTAVIPSSSPGAQISQLVASPAVRQASNVKFGSWKVQVAKLLGFPPACFVQLSLCRQGLLEFPYCNQLGPLRLI